jgi:hypothetical protein
MCAHADAMMRSVSQVVPVALVALIACAQPPPSSSVASSSHGSSAPTPAVARHEPDPSDDDNSRQDAKAPTPAATADADPVVVAALDRANGMLRAIAAQDMDALVALLPPKRDRDRKRLERVASEWLGHTAGVAETHELRADGERWVAHVRDVGWESFVIVLRRLGDATWEIRGLKSPRTTRYRELTVVWRADLTSGSEPLSGDDAIFHDNLDTLCRMQREINEDASLDSDEKRVTAIAGRIQLVDPLESFLLGLASVGRGKRYPVILAEARRRGVPRWSCSAMHEQDSRGPDPAK